MQSYLRKLSSTLTNLIIQNFTRQTPTATLTATTPTAVRSCLLAVNIPSFAKSKTYKFKNSQDPYACGGGTYYTSFNWFGSIQELEIISHSQYLNSMLSLQSLLASFWTWSLKVWGPAVLCREPWLPSWAGQPGGARFDQAASGHQWAPSSSLSTLHRSQYRDSIKEPLQ